MKYYISVIYGSYETLTIEADNVQEAFDKAYEEADRIRDLRDYGSFQICEDYSTEEDEEKEDE